MLHKMGKSFNVSPAAWTLNGSYVAVNGNGLKPVLDGIRCFARQKSVTKFRLVEQFNRMSPNRAFLSRE